MTNNILISTIIPTYNCEKYIEECLNSLLKQDFKEIEYIFINDCSTDNSLEIINKYAAIDSRIKVINNPKNLGRGPTRNIGISLAKGKYLSFVDPDDYISDNFYKTLYQKAIETDCDIIKGQRALNNQLSNLNKILKKSLENNKPLYCFFISEHQSAIYKNAFIKKNNIEYGTSNCSQDKTFLLRLCLNNPTISFVSDAIYYYCKRDESITNEYTIDRCNFELDALEESIASLSTSKKDDNYYNYIKTSINYISKIFSITSYYEKKYDQQYIDRLKNIIKTMPNYKLLLNNSINLNILFEDNYFIPVVSDDINIQLDTLKRWFNYIKDNNKYIDYFSLELTKTIYRISRKNDSQEKNKAYSFIRHEFSKLNAKEKIQIYTRIPISLIILIYRKIKRLVY